LHARRGLLLIGVVGACRTTPKVIANPTLDDTLTVMLGTTVATSDLTARITYDRKLPDSRCAIGHTCVWQGDGAAGLIIEREGQRTHASVHTAVEPRVIGVADLTISLVGLSPHPGDTTWTKPPVAQVRVTRKR
jgi:hypothetical protein